MSNFGMDLFLESQKNNINSKNDILVIFMHWMLVKNNFRNVGVGDNKIPSDEDKPSELLPPGWNSDQNTYKLRYTLEKKIYIFHALKSDDTLIVNLLDAVTLETTSLVFEVEKLVKSSTGSTLEDYVMDSDALMDRISKEIIKPIINKKSEGQKKQEESRSTDPLLVQPPSYARDPYANPLRIDPLRDVGRGDLDPFRIGPVGGGMIFPMPPQRFPHGGAFPGAPPLHPPGARFDPINPWNNRRDPDNDHFRPPGPPPDGYDDMFM